MHLLLWWGNVVAHNNLVAAYYRSPNLASCKRNSQIDLYFGLVLIEDERVGDRYVKKEVVYILIKFPTLCAAAVVASQLITVIDCTHPPLLYRITLWNWDSGAVLLPPQHSPHS